MEDNKRREALHTGKKTHIMATSPQIEEGEGEPQTLICSKRGVRDRERAERKKGRS